MTARVSTFVAIVLSLAACTAQVTTSDAIPPLEAPVAYFGNTHLNPQEECDSVFPVARSIAQTADQPLQLLHELFAGPTVREREMGYASLFNEFTADLVQSVRVLNGTAYVDLHEIRELIANASSSCGSAAFLAQIESTLMQYPEIHRVIFAIEGDTRTFYDWIQIGCTPENDNCNNAAFAGH